LELTATTTSAGNPILDGQMGGGGGGLGNRVNATVMATVLASQLAATKQFLTAQGIGSQINVTI